MIYENVKTACEKKGMSISELERKADLGNGTIGKWKQGAHPTIATLQKIADALGISIKKILE